MLATMVIAKQELKYFHGLLRGGSIEFKTPGVLDFYFYLL